jgi:hypothetical protein
MRMEYVMERATVKRQRQPVAARYVAASHSLCSPAAQAAIEKMQQEFIADPKKADDFLFSAGIITRTGRLSKRFGGK